MNFCENENIEFKLEYTSDIKKTVVAFANTKGGTLYIGVPASEELIRQMIKETNGDKFEEVRSFNQELTFEYAKVEFKSKNLKLNQVQMKTLGIQDKEGLYTNLGLLLSDQCLHSIKVAYFDGKDKNAFKDRREFNGSLLKQLSDSFEYIDLFNKTKASFSGLNRIDKKDYPAEAIREALINSIVHREYSFSGSTLINVFGDRIEFVSLGGLVTGLTLEDIMIGVSQCRNEKLANIFYRLKLIEAYGTGISKIFSSYNGNEKTPVINATYGAFQVILPNLNYIDIDLVKEEEESYFSNPQYTKILSCIKENGSITRSETQNILNVGQTRAINILKEISNKGLIKKVGKGKNTKYVK